MGNKDSKTSPLQEVTSNLDTANENEASEMIFPSDPDYIREFEDLSNVRSANEDGIQSHGPSSSRSQSRSPVKTPRKPTRKLSNPVASFQEFIESCNAMPDYNSVATIEYARKFIHDGFSKCSGEDLKDCLSILLENFYKSFEKINMYRDIFYLIYKDSRYTHLSAKVFSLEFDKIFQQEKEKIAENSKWGEVVMFGALLCELLTIYQADSFLVTKQLNNWIMDLIKSAVEENENGLIALMLILNRLSTNKSPLKERHGHYLGVLRILLRDGDTGSKTQEIYNFLEQRRLAILVDYESLEESKYSEEVSKSEKCREFEKFLHSDNERARFNINLFRDITDNELEFFARKFIEVAVQKPQKIKFLTNSASKYQNVLNSIRKITNNVVKHLEEEIEVMRQKGPKKSIPIINFAKFIAELYVNERKIISPVMMTSWLSLLTELGESTAIASTLKLCGYFYKIDEPENFEKFMDSISIFWGIVNDEIKKFSDQLNGKGQEVYSEYHKSRMFQPNPTAAAIDDLQTFLFEISRNKNANFDYQNLLDFRHYDCIMTTKAVITEVSKPNANVIKLAEFLKSFFEFSFKIGKFVKRLKINFELMISEMSMDNPEEIKNVGKLIGELRNYAVIDKIPQEKWLEMMEDLRPMENIKLLEIHLEVLKVMFQNLIIHEESKYFEYFSYIQQINTADPQIKSKILQITENFVPKTIDKASKDVLFRVKFGLKIDGLPQDIPQTHPEEFDLNDFVKIFFVSATTNRFLVENYAKAIKALSNGPKGKVFLRLLHDLSLVRYNSLLDPELFDEDEAVGTLKFIVYVHKQSILTEQNIKSFLQSILNFEDFETHKNCLKFLVQIIKNDVVFTGHNRQGVFSQNLRELLKKVQAKLNGIENPSVEEQEEEIEIWHIVDFQGSTNDQSLFTSESIEPSQLAWSFTENYRVVKNKIQNKQKSAQNSTKSHQNSTKNDRNPAKNVQKYPKNHQKSNQASSNSNRNNQRGRIDKRPTKIDWNVTRGDLKGRNDLQHQGVPKLSQRINQNSPLYEQSTQKTPSLMKNNRMRHNSNQNHQNLNQNNQLINNSGRPFQNSMLNQQKSQMENILNPNLFQNSQMRQNYVQNPQVSPFWTQNNQVRPNLIQNSQTTQNLAQNNQMGLSWAQGSQIGQNLVHNIRMRPNWVPSSPVTQNSAQNNQTRPFWAQNMKIEQKPNQFAQNLTANQQRDQKIIQTDQKVSTNDQMIIKSDQNVNSSALNVQTSQKSTGAIPKNTNTSSANQASQNSTQSVHATQNASKVDPKSATNDQSNQNLDTFASKTQNMTENFQKLSAQSVPADLIVIFNEFMPMISTNTSTFKGCAILIHGWGTENPAMRPAIKELIILVSNDLKKSHKQLLFDMSNKLTNECDELRRKLGFGHVQQKNLFITEVKAVVPFLERHSFYNMLDDLLGHIKSGNQLALVLFLDLTEEMKDFLREDSKERDKFVPSCVKVMENATKFKGEEATRKRTSEMLKFFQSLKINAMNTWRDNANSGVQRAGSAHSFQSSNGSSKGSKTRRGSRGRGRVRNNQTTGKTNTNSKQNVSKSHAAAKSSNITSKTDSILKAGNINSKSNNITSNIGPNQGTSRNKPQIQVTGKLNQSNQAHGSKSDITSKLAATSKTEPNKVAEKSSTNATKPKNTLSDPPENFNVDDKIKFSINQLNPSNIAAVGFKISPFLAKEFTKRKVLEASLQKGISDQKFISPVIDLFQLLFINKDGFGKTKLMMANVIGEKFVHLCENENDLPQKILNLVKFTAEFEPFLMNSFIFILWRELLQFVESGNVRALHALVFMMDDKLELFYETSSRKQYAKEFLMTLKENLKSAEDKNLKDKMNKIIRSLESGEVEAKYKKEKEIKSKNPQNRGSTPQVQKAKEVESSAQKTKDLVKLFGGSDSEDCDLFKKIKTEIESGESSKNVQQVQNNQAVGNLTSNDQGVQKSDQNIEKSNLSDQNLEIAPQKMEVSQSSTQDDSKVFHSSEKIDEEAKMSSQIDTTSTSSNIPDNSTKSVDKQEQPTQSILSNKPSALLELQVKLQQMSTHNTSNLSSHIQKSGSSSSEDQDKIRQAKLIKGITKQLNSIEFENKSSESEQLSSSDNQDQSSSDPRAVEHDPNNTPTPNTDNSKFREQSQLDESSTSEIQNESTTVDESDKKSTYTRPHPDDVIRPLIFTSDYILFDDSVENAQKFENILKVLSSNSIYEKDSIRIKENIAIAIIKLNYLKTRAEVEDFEKFSDSFFKYYTHPNQTSIVRFILLKFLKAWKFYEEKVENSDEVDANVYDRYSKSICRIKKSFKISCDVNMEDNITSKSKLTLKFDETSVTGTVPKSSNNTSAMNTTSKSVSAPYFTIFVENLQNLLIDFLSGVVKAKHLSQADQILARKSVTRQLICDLYLQGMAQPDFVFYSIQKLLEHSDHHPDHFDYLSEIVKNVGALLQIRESKEIEQIFFKISSKSQKHPKITSEIFELRQNRYANVENFTPIFLLFHENPGKFFGFIETLWKRLMENPVKVAELSEIVEELLENLGDNFAFLISEFMENRRISFEKIPPEMYSKMVSQRLKGSILFVFELFEMQIVNSERFAGWFKEEVFGKLGDEEKGEISTKLKKRGMDVDENLAENLNEQFEKLNIF